MDIDFSLTPADLVPAIERMWELSAAKVMAIERRLGDADASPVFTVEGRYTARGWTDWTQGFQFGSALLQFDATGDAAFLRLGTDSTLRRMPPHVTHFGVHDHGFNNISTYGALWRLMAEGRISDEHRDVCDLALRCSGAVQAQRWTPTADGGGFVHSFNGPHSLFVDTIRSMRSLGVAHLLGHALLGEQDVRVSLLDRLCHHLIATATWSVYYGEDRDAYDVRGRTAHEAIFNPRNGVYRCPSTQQGFSPFSTWTRGLAWAMCGFAEELEYLTDALGNDDATQPSPSPTHERGGHAQVRQERERGLGRQDDAAIGEVARAADRAAEATCEFYIENAAADGIPYWDTGAPGLPALGDWRSRASEPYNDHEPVDSSAAAIAAQGLLRFGRGRALAGDSEAGTRYVQAGLTIARTLFGEPYLITDSGHEGLMAHSVYHRPNGWDHVPEGRKVPCGEASMWGDYHARELAVYIARLAVGGSYPVYWGNGVRSKGRTHGVGGQG